MLKINCSYEGGRKLTHETSGQLTMWPGHRSTVHWNAIASCYNELSCLREDSIGGGIKFHDQTLGSSFS